MSHVAFTPWKASTLATQATVVAQLRIKICHSFLAQVFLASVEIRKRFRASLSRKLGQEQNKIGMSLFLAPALTFAQLLDGKRLVRRLRYLNKLNKSPGVRGVNPWESC